MNNLDKRYEKFINFLLEKNCQNIPHSHSNFLNHLIGTFNILKKWKQPEYICIAGMFHNIYGNKYFNPKLNVTREEIKKIIGDVSEELVYNFVNCDRTKINEENNSELIILNLANSLDQKKLFIVEDNLYNKDSCKNTHEYFKYVNWNFEGSNLSETSSKWKYNLNYRYDTEIKFLEVSELLLKKYGLNKIFKLKRAYASASTYGFSGEYHTDDDAKEYNEIVTIMFYLNDKWDLNFGGETFFLNEDKNEIEYAVIPKPARAVIFDGFIYHGPRPLNKICNELRMVLTFKYGLINN
jgi:hypothetical protein